MDKKRTMQYFVTCIKKVENEKYEKIINFEKRGITKQFTSNFGKKYLPGPTKKIIAKASSNINVQPITSKIQPKKQTSTKRLPIKRDTKNTSTKRKAGPELKVQINPKKCQISNAMAKMGNK